MIFRCSWEGEFEPRIYAVEMFAIDDAQYAGHLQCLGRIDAENSRVGVRAQERRAVRSARQIRQIFDVLRLAGDFISEDRCAAPRRPGRLPLLVLDSGFDLVNRPRTWMRASA